VFEPTGSRRDAASMIFNLPDYRVIDALERPGGARVVVVGSTAPAGCPGCGVVATRVHSRRRQLVRDVPVAGAVAVVWGKRRWFCTEAACARRTFAESTVQVPPGARSTQSESFSFTAISQASASSRSVDAASATLAACASEGPQAAATAASALNSRALRSAATVNAFAETCDPEPTMLRR